MSAAVISTLSALLKEFYLAPIQEQLNQEVLVLELMEKALVDWAGRRVVIPLHTNRNTAVSFKSDGDALPAIGVSTFSGQEGYSRAEVDAKFLYGRFQITGPAISSLAKGGTASFAGYVQAEMDKLVEDVRVKANDAAFTGGPVIGVLNEYQAGAKATTWQFTGNITKMAAIVAEAVAFKAGSVITATVSTSYTGDFGSANGGYETIATAEITAASVANGTITVGTALDTTQTTSAIALPRGYCAVVTLTGALDASGGAAIPAASVPTLTAALTAEPQGIFGNLGSQTHFSVARNFVAPATDNTPILRSNIFAANNLLTQTRVALSLPLVQNVFDQIMQVSGQEPNYILMSPTQRQRYVALLQGTIGGTMFSQAGDAKKIADGGYVGLSYGNCPIKVSQNSPKGCLVFMKLDEWKLCQLEKGDFADLDGAVISRVPGFDTYEGYYRTYYNTICVRPNANGILAGLSL
jgi:hypothetical protein